LPPVRALRTGRRWFQKSDGKTIVGSRGQRKREGKIGGKEASKEKELLIGT